MRRGGPPEEKTLVSPAQHTFIFDQNKDDTQEEKVLVRQFNSKTSYLFLFHQVSRNVTPALPRESEDV